MTRYFDDLELGATERFGRYKVTREEVIEFASNYDPQLFHLEDEAASKSIFGKISASGWHTCSMMMRMQVDHWKDIGIDKASLGGMGMDELRWTKPVYPGDILSCEVTLIEKKVSKSKPDRGIVKSRCKVYNQDGDIVLTMVSTGIFRSRPAIAE
ncbi:MAG: MaoC family dehydratase [Sphingobium sp.]